jgi:hypothetical protein
MTSLRVTALSIDMLFRVSGVMPISIAVSTVADERDESKDDMNSNSSDSGLKHISTADSQQVG